MLSYRKEAGFCMNRKYAANPLHISFGIQSDAPEIQHQHLCICTLDFFLHHRFVKEEKL